jgi:hypothetical protein
MWGGTIELSYVFGTGNVPNIPTLISKTIDFLLQYRLFCEHKLASESLRDSEILLDHLSSQTEECQY